MSEQAAQLKFFWNKTHLNILSINEVAIDMVASFSYSGRSPQSFLEYLDSIKPGHPELKGLSLEEITAQSYTIYDYYNPHYFPIKSVLPKVNTAVCDLILQKLGVEQLVILDVDNAYDCSLIKYTIADGLQMNHFSLDTPDLDNKIVYTDVKKVWTKQFLQSLFGKVKLVEDASTAWLVTGEVVTASNNNVAVLVRELFLNLEVALPPVNVLLIDKFQLFNYLSSFSEGFLKPNLTRIFEVLPFTIFNLDLLPDRNNIKLRFAHNNVVKTVKVFDNIINLVRVDAAGFLFDYRFLKFAKGYIWFYNKAKDSKLTPAKLLTLATMTFPKLKQLNVLQHTLRLEKQATWEVKLSKDLLEKIEVGRRLELEADEISQHYKPEHYLLVGNVKKTDLSVINGQKVAKGEQLNNTPGWNLLSTRKRILAPASGVVSTKYLDSGFLKISETTATSKDMSWLNEVKARVIGKSDTRVKLQLKVTALPLYYTQGKGQLEVALFAPHLGEAFDLLSAAPGSIAIINERLSVQEIEKLYSAGAKAIVAPSVESLRLPKNYFQLFGLGVLNQTATAFPPSIAKLFFEQQFTEVYLNVELSELQFPAEKSGFKFAHSYTKEQKQKLQDQQSRLRKGARVLLTTPENLFREAKVLHIDKESGELILRDLNSAQVYKQPRERVSIV